MKRIDIAGFRRAKASQFAWNKTCTLTFWLFLEEKNPRPRDQLVLWFAALPKSLGHSSYRYFGTRGEVEFPSDYAGVIYLQFGATDEWKTQLARELISAGAAVTPSGLL